MSAKDTEAATAATKVAQTTGKNLQSKSGSLKQRYSKSQILLNTGTVQVKPSLLSKGTAQVRLSLLNKGTVQVIPS